MSCFPNKAGDHSDTDAILTGELETAGIKVIVLPYRQTNQEVKTSIVGVLHGWRFNRAWYYWVCSGPGIPVEVAEKLHASHGQTVRVDGHAGCPSPRKWFKGLACGNYHVDDQDGLNALAATIRGIVEQPEGTVAPVGEKEEH